MTLMPSKLLNSRFDRLLPIKPAAPVTNMVLPLKSILYSSIRLISLENVPCIYLVFHVIQAGIIAVGDDGGGLPLERIEVVNNFAAEEGVAVRQSWLIDDNRCTLGLDALHNALDGRLAEVVGVALHRQAVHADDYFFLLIGFPAGIFMVIPGFLQHGVGDVVLARAVALDDGGHHVLGHVGVVGQELLGVLGQAVAAVAEGGVVVVRADARVEADALDDGATVEALDFGVGVELVEVAHAQGEVGVGEELDGLGFFHAHEEGGDVVFDCAFLQEAGEGLGIRLCLGVADGFDGGVLFVELGAFYHLGVAHDDAAGIEVVVEGFALSQELGGEEEVEALVFELGLEQELQGVFLIQAAGVAHGDGALDDHHGIGVDFQDEVDDVFYVVGVEEVLDGVVVGGGGDDHEVGVAVGGAAVEGGGEPQFFFGEVFLDVLVLYGGDAAVDLVYFLGYDVHGGDVVVLRQEGGDAQAYVACACHGDF